MPHILIKNYKPRNYIIHVLWMEKMYKPAPKTMSSWLIIYWHDFLPIWTDEEALATILSTLHSKLSTRRRMSKLCSFNIKSFGFWLWYTSTYFASREATPPFLQSHPTKQHVERNLGGKFAIFGLPNECITFKLAITFNNVDLFPMLPCPTILTGRLPLSWVVVIAATIPSTWINVFLDQPTLLLAKPRISISYNRRAINPPMYI